MASDAAAAPIRIGLVGLGKIARDQHIPALRADPRFELVAAATTAGSCDDLPIYPSLGAMIAATPDLAAVALCTPPQVRGELAREALDHGLHVLLEKPPGVTVGEAEELADRAAGRQLAVFASWHAREAPGVGPAASWLARRVVRKVDVIWKEDVRIWHPGQRWIWERGGLGVFDPGINALSIVTFLVMPRLFVERAELHIPVNCETPIAATLALTDGAGAIVDATLDFRQSGREQWDIAVDTDAGRLVLRDGGAALEIDGAPVALPAAREYPRLYDHFAALIRAVETDVDTSPLQLVADAFLIGRRIAAERFDDPAV